MGNELEIIPGFDDIVFEIRNKEYGAYILRKKYSGNVLISIMAGVFVLAAAVIVPYLNARSQENRQKRAEREVEIRMMNLEQPDQAIIPPLTPPPPPADVVQQAKYVPPIVVDSVKPDETIQLMTADEAQLEVRNEDVIEVIEVVKEEIREEENDPEPFIVVEEMPVPNGGDSGLLRYIADNTVYPEVAKENNIQGKVIVKFCVTSKGGIDQVTIFKGVDPELDAEAIRVVKSLPHFKPGRQGGKPVPVWFTVPINFQLK